MDVRGAIHHYGFRTRVRRGLTVATIAATATVGTVALGGLLTAGAATTNGERVLWVQQQCLATIVGQNLLQIQDLPVQAVVPNTAAQNAAYDSTIPGGTTTLPAVGAGLAISSFNDIRQVYLFRSSTGVPAITSAVAQGGATNNGNPVTFNTSFTNEGTSVAVTTAAWTSDSGGTITYTTGVAHGVSKSQVIDITGFQKTGYNATGTVVSSVPSTTQFTVHGRPMTVNNAVWAAGDITFTSNIAHGIKVGESVTTVGSAPARYNRTGVVTAVPSTTQFTVAGGATDPGPITTKGQIATLANPTAIGTSTPGSVRTLTTFTSTVPLATPGPLTVPDVVLSMTAPSANATVTSYGAVVTLTANVGLGPAVTVCNLPHQDPQTDGISATLVGTGGPTTTSYPACRPPDVCATTTTTAPPAPSVSVINPTSGSTAGGTSVTVTGANLSGASDVSFGGTAAASFTVDSASQVTAVSPAHAAGPVDVTVTTAGGTSATLAADVFTFVAPPAPSVSVINPTSGSTAGGTSVTVTGANLSGASDVSFGGTAAASFTVDSASQVTAVSPAHAAGPVDITVTTSAGTSTTSAADVFTFVAPPAPSVSAINPTSGSTAGGTSVTVTGADLSDVSDVSFGGTAAASFTVDSASQITAVSPAHAAGPVDITVTSTAGTSTATPADVFTFEVPAPTCSGSCIVLGDTSMLETDAGTHALLIPVTLSAPASGIVTVDYTVTDGTASGGTAPGPGR